MVGRSTWIRWNQKTLTRNQSKRTKSKAEAEEAAIEEVKENVVEPTSESTPEPEVKEETEVEAEVSDKVVAEEAPEKKDEDESNTIPTRVEKLSGPTVVGRIDLPEKRIPKKKPVASSKDKELQLDQKKKRKHLQGDWTCRYWQTG